MLLHTGILLGWGCLQPLLRARQVHSRLQKVVVVGVGVGWVSCCSSTGSSWECHLVRTVAWQQVLGTQQETSPTGSMQCQIHQVLRQLLADQHVMCSTASTLVRRCMQMQVMPWGALPGPMARTMVLVVKHQALTCLLASLAVQDPGQLQEGWVLHAARGRALLLQGSTPQKLLQQVQATLGSSAALMGPLLLQCPTPTAQERLCKGALALLREASLLLLGHSTTALLLLAATPLDPGEAPWLNLWSRAGLKQRGRHVLLV
jgi:hypothetical protein